MKINNVQRNQNTNFKARLDVQIAKDYVNFLRRLSEHDSAMTCRCAQEAVDTVELLKNAAPVIGDNTDILSLKSGVLTSNEGALNLLFNGKEFGTLYANDNMEGFAAYYIGKLTDGVLKSRDLLPETNQFWTPFSEKSKISQNVIRSLHDEHHCNLIQEETVTPDEMIERVMQLDTVG